MSILTWIDWTIIGIYFALLFGLAWWVILQNRDTADDYFLAGRNLSWWIIGGSIFASNIGSEHLVGLGRVRSHRWRGHGALRAACLVPVGLGVGAGAVLHAVQGLHDAGVPRATFQSHEPLGIVSDYAGRLCRHEVGGGHLCRRRGVRSAAARDADRSAQQFLGGLDPGGGVDRSVYTILGGLRAVAYTEAMQTCSYARAGLRLLVHQCSGLKAELGRLVDELPSRDLRQSDMFNLWKPLVPAGVEATWAPCERKRGDADGVVLQRQLSVAEHVVLRPVIGLWYWCTDQYIVQRVLGAPNETQARRGSICAAYLKLLPVFIFIIPGMICFALATSGRNEALQQIIVDSQGKVIRDQAQQAFPLLVAHVLPVGVRGMVVAGLLAALMSSLAGASMPPRRCSRSTSTRNSTRTCRSTSSCGSGAWPPSSWC